MSLFRTQELPCPVCGTPVSFELVHSVNADRRPDYRDAILERNFQKQPCPTCGTAFRVEPEFTYIDVKRHQWIAAWPASGLRGWPGYEDRTRSAWDKAFGKQAPPAAQELGRELQPRAVFGWPALREKLVAAEAGIDDRALELAKVAVVRSLDAAPALQDVELRLLDVDPAGEDGPELVLGWVRLANEEVFEVLRVSRALLDELAADAPAWEPIRQDLGEGPFLDFQRLTVATA